MNIAARIEPLAEPGGLCISGSVYEQVRNQVDIEFIDFGEHQLKHVSAPVKAEAAIADAEIALRLSPKDPQNAIFLGGIALAHYLADRYEEALSAVHETMRLRPGFVPAYRLKCAALARAGRIPEAQAVLEKIRTLQPDVSASRLRKMLPYPTSETLEKSSATWFWPALRSNPLVQRSGRSPRRYRAPGRLTPRMPVGQTFTAENKKRLTQKK